MRQAQQNPTGDAAESHSVGTAEATGKASVDDQLAELSEAATADADDDEKSEIPVTRTPTSAITTTSTTTTTSMTTATTATTTSPVPRILIECRIPRPISEKWQKSGGCPGHNAYKCGGSKKWRRKREYCCCNTGCRYLVRNGKTTCGDCASESDPDVAERWTPKSLLKKGKCDDKLHMHECGSGNGCCCHAGYTWNGMTETCVPDEIKYVGKWDINEGACTRVEQEESHRTGSSIAVDRLIKDQASTRGSLLVIPAKVECQIPNSEKWQSVLSSCANHNAYKCGPKLSTGKRNFCCCRTGCRVILREGKATCGACQDDGPDVKQQLIPEAFLKNPKCKDKYRMHACGIGCCCNAGFSFNKNSMECGQDAIKYVAKLNMHKLKCTEVHQVEYATGEVTTLEEPMPIPESIRNPHPEQRIDEIPRTTPPPSGTALETSSDSESDDINFRTESPGWPEDDRDWKPPVSTGSTTHKPSFPFWLFPVLVFGVVLVAVIAFHYTGGTHRAEQ
eukprot:TRINITY_DN57363_c0_g1_i1.p1 TRINITY_DN57363_c0_g1~~TRINITY_DN57363_c0_g1_i1.p1  ORF type:complete len:548 (+),score=67.47 TRINITY_DN57363_c0_g1_i1:124-1644(+)